MKALNITLCIAGIIAIQASAATDNDKLLVTGLMSLIALFWLFAKRNPSHHSLTLNSTDNEQA